MKDNVLTSSALKFYHDLRRYILSKVHNAEDADDIVQTVFLKIMNSDGPDKEEKLISWLFSVAQHTVIDFYRKRNKRILFAEVAQTDNEAIKNEVADCLPPLIKTLSLSDQTILNAVDIQHIPLKDYAIAEQLTYSNAKSKIHRARKRLKNTLLNCCQLTFDRYNIPVDCKAPVQ